MQEVTRSKDSGSNSISSNRAVTASSTVPGASLAIRVRVSSTISAEASTVVQRVSGNRVASVTVKLPVPQPSSRPAPGAGGRYSSVVSSIAWYVGTARRISESYSSIIDAK